MTGSQDTKWDGQCAHQHTEYRTKLDKLELTHENIGPTVYLVAVRTEREQEENGRERERKPELVKTRHRECPMVRYNSGI